MFQSICRDAVKFGGMKMAWIGMIDESGYMVRPVASFGRGIDYLEGIEISVDPTTSTGRGPSGTSIREDRPIWCQDFQKDSATLPWRERSSAYGWAASASLPIHRNGKPVGAITFYSDVAHAFDEAAQCLLAEMATDISFALDHFELENARNSSLAAFEQSERQLRTIIETEPECVKLLDGRGRLIHMNSAGLNMLEVVTLEEAVRSNILDFVAPEYSEAFKELHRRVINGESGYLEFEIIGKRGTRKWVETHAAPLLLNSESTVLGITRDVTERKRTEERVRYLANYDALTGLPNRNQLDSHISFAVGISKRNHESFAVMFLDLDRFKDINDSLGHKIGDALLVEISERLRSALREQDRISRLGGDEFILFLADCDMLGAVQVAKKLLEAIKSPCRIEHYELCVTASIGIALYPNDGESQEALFKSADSAMYRAKKAGRNRYSFFTREMQAQAVRNMQLLNALRTAVEREELWVEYQPQISLSEWRIVGAEALIRWRHPELGLVSPAEFIPLAEDSGLIMSIGEWVLRTAVAQLRRWMDSGHSPFVVSVNLSAIQFRNSGLPELLSQVLNELGLPAQYLELELTEGVVINELDSEVTTIQRIHEQGIRMSIDDFGTGYSSLSYLKRFKFYKLKIDQTFVRDIAGDADSRAIVSAIISMAKSLGLKTIAEGVETLEQLEFLKQSECDEIQGYYFSRPLAAEKFDEFMRKYRRCGVDRSGAV